MSAEANPTDQPTTSTESLQFDRAEFNQGAALPCSFCKAPITGPYFQVNAQTACPNCREQIDAAFTGGSKIARTLRASIAGIGAAIAGFVIYWGIRAVTGYELGLVAILIGFMVGGAVRWGAQSRGGLFYQLMAVVLTYLSIASNYTPDVLQGMRNPQAEETAADENAATATTAAANPTGTAADNKVAPTTTPTTDAPERQLPLWFALPIAFVISLAVPFMSGLENIIGWIIIAFGLMQAWRINKRVPVQVTGPFTSGAPPQAATLQT
jgi:hypothetical protein